MRFLLVSLVAEAISLLLLTLLVEAGGLTKVPAQAIAVAAVDAAQLPRQQALELSRRAPEIAPRRVGDRPAVLAGPAGACWHGPIL